MRRLLTDIHCHGAARASFGESEADSRRAAAFHAAQGVQIGAASLVSGTPAQLGAQARRLAPLVADGTIGGIHLEGPFLAHSCRGAHDPAVLRDPDPRLIDDIAEALAAGGAPGGVKQVTFAPELPGAADLIATMAGHGIVPAFGHTAATAEQVTAAIDTTLDVCRRAPIITHLFNGMPPFHHRCGGPAAAALAAAGRGEAYVELIADGVHVAAEVVRMVFASVHPDYVVLVSDAIAATGLGDGGYRLGALEVVVTDGTARLRTEDGSPGAIAGSTWTLADGVRWAVEVAGVPEADVLRAATENPRRALGLS